MNDGKIERVCVWFFFVSINLKCKQFILQCLFPDYSKFGFVSGLQTVYVWDNVSFQSVSSFKIKKNKNDFSILK